MIATQHYCVDGLVLLSSHYSIGGQISEGNIWEIYAMIDVMHNLRVLNYESFGEIIFILLLTLLKICPWVWGALDHEDMWNPKVLIIVKVQKETNWLAARYWSLLATTVKNVCRLQLTICLWMSRCGWSGTHKLGTRPHRKYPAPTPLLIQTYTHTRVYTPLSISIMNVQM